MRQAILIICVGYSKEVNSNKSSKKSSLIVCMFSINSFIVTINQIKEYFNKIGVDLIKVD